MQVGGLYYFSDSTSNMTLFLLLCFFGSVQSCRTVSRSGVTLTGVCPNDTFTVPIGKVLDYECTADYTGYFELYWNISGVAVNQFGVKPFGISRITDIGTKSILTIMAGTNNTLLNIQCGLCNRTVNLCNNPVRFLETESVQLITFGKLFH